MESGMNGFVPPTEVVETTEAIQRKLDSYGRMIKTMEEKLLQDLTKNHPEFSNFKIFIDNDSIQIASNTHRSGNHRLVIKHNN